LSAQIIRQAGEGCDLATPEGRARLLAAAKPLWAALPEAGMLRRQLLGEIAQVAQLPIADLSEAWGQPKARFSAQRSESRLAPRLQSAATRRLQQLPPGPADQALRMLLRHSDWWDQLSSEDHELLHALPEPHGSLFAWLDRQLHEHGALPRGTLQTALAEAGHAEFTTRLMNSMATEDSVEFSDLRTVLNYLWRLQLSRRSEVLVERGVADPQSRLELQEVLGRLRALGVAPVKS
jgi:DNA primase